jgi:YHS domain-containing protein
MRNILLLFLCCAAVWGQRDPKAPALQGLDPVLLTEGRDVDGKDSITVQRGRFLYHFASEETRAKFTREPDRYAIQLGGACARMGPPTGGNADAFVVHEGRIYIMGSQECYRHFKAAPAKFLEGAQPEWTPTAEQRAKGAELLKKSMDALGGADRFSAVKAYVETRKLESPRGVQTVTRAALLPASVRTETKFEQNSFGSLVTPEGGFNVFRGEGQRLPESFAREVLNTWRHDLPAILVARGGKEFDAFAAGDGVKVRNHGTVSTLQIDAATGEIKSVAFRGRGPGGEYGEVRIDYSDYRDAGGGVRLPFKAAGVFNGEAGSRGNTWTVESYELNPADIAARLKAPEKIREN